MEWKHFFGSLSLSVSASGECEKGVTSHPWSSLHVLPPSSAFSGTCGVSPVGKDNPGLRNYPRLHRPVSTSALGVVSFTRCFPAPRVAVGICTRPWQFSCGSRRPRTHPMGCRFPGSGRPSASSTWLLTALECMDRLGWGWGQGHLFFFALYAFLSFQLTRPKFKSGSGRGAAKISDPEGTESQSGPSV